MGVIGGPSWVEWRLKLAAMLVSNEIRSFSPVERDELAKAKEILKNTGHEVDVHSPNEK